MEIEDSVKFVRLTTGEDLVSQILEVNKDEPSAYYLLINPLKIVYLTGNKPGVLSISLMQWVFHRVCDVQEFTIYPNDVITMANPSESLVEYYWDSIEHFTTVGEKLKKNTQFGNESEEELTEEVMDEGEIVEAIQELLGNTGKRTLH